jgi:hypothetical protein
VKTLTREEALNLVKKYVKNKNLVKHMLATEVVMKALAERLGYDAESWGLVGLLHDIDYDMTKDEPEKHGLISIELLKDYKLSDEMLNAIKAHSGKKELETPMEKALYAVDPVTGLIVAAALIRPEKKLEVIDTQFVLNRFKEKSFAKGANREQIKSIESLGLSLEEFIDIALNAMKGISSDLGL